MSDNDILTILKVDLQISSTALDSYLLQLIGAARALIVREGVTLTDDIEDTMLIEMYAAYLYRKRRESNSAMPRMLRWALNNRLLSVGEDNADG